MSRWLYLVCVVLCACRGRFDVIADATDGDARSDARPGDPSAVKLLSKHVYGAPDAVFTIAFSPVDSPDPVLRFLDSANRVVHTSNVSATGKVTLPAIAGVYQLALYDRVTGGISYGQATVSLPVSSFSSIQQMALPGYSPFAPIWPNAALAAGDLDGDGYADLVRATGLSTSTQLQAAGIFIQRWAPGIGLGQQVTIALPEHQIRSIVLLDFEVDGDSDIVYVAERVDTLEHVVCCSTTASAASRFRCARVNRGPRHRTFCKPGQRPPTSIAMGASIS